MKRYSKPEIEKHIKSWRESGNSGQQYCRDNEIKATTFYSWLKVERKESKSGFVQVTTAVPKAVSSTIILEIGKYKIHIPPGFRDNDLRDILDFLEQPHV